MYVVDTRVSYRDLANSPFRLAKSEAMEGGNASNSASFCRRRPPASPSGSSTTSGYLTKSETSSSSSLWDPSEVVAILRDSLAASNPDIPCSNSETGCAFVGTLAEVSSHVDDGCSYKSCFCPWIGCNFRVGNLASTH